MLSASSLQTFGIIDWTIQELETIDKRTRKILSMNGSFHPNSDIDRLYIPRYQGGRGLKAVRSLFECRIASLYNHLQTYRERNEYMNYVYQQEENETIRVGKELLNKNNVVASVTDTPKQTGKKLLRQLQEEKTKSYKEKMMHGYFRKTIEQNENIDHKESQQWLQDKYLTSHFVAYACAIEEQEIATKYLLNKRQRDEGKTPTINNKCRLCKTNVEDITHIISACPMMSSRYYLPLRHDPIAKIIFQEHVKNNSNEKLLFCNENEFIEKVGYFEYWWNVPIHTSTKLPHNKPDLLIWDKKSKTCTVIEISCPADINITRKINEKMERYAPLMRNLQMMYNDYKFEMVPIVIGAFGFIPKDLKTSLESLNFDKKEVKCIIRKLQATAVSGTVKIVKTFIRFKM